MRHICKQQGQDTNPNEVCFALDVPPINTIKNHQLYGITKSSYRFGQDCDDYNGLYSPLHVFFNISLHFPLVWKTFYWNDNEGIPGEDVRQPGLRAGAVIPGCPTCVGCVGHPGITSEYSWLSNI